MTDRKVISGATAVLLAGFVAGSLFVSTALAQSAAANASAAGSAKPATAHSPYQPSRFPKRARKYYGLVWGVDSLSVKSVEAGELLRFSYRVVDADAAKMLNDKKVEAYLIGYRARVKLSIPALDNLGLLRQSSPPEAGKSYWMAFSNKGKLVKPGDRVSVVVGSFRADGLVVQ